MSRARREPGSALAIPQGRITYHVLEAPDPAAALVEFAHSNSVDQIVIGSRGSSMLRRYLGSVSSQVVAQAHCTVTVVKAAEAGAARPAEESEQKETAKPHGSAILETPFAEGR